MYQSLEIMWDISLVPNFVFLQCVHSESTECLHWGNPLVAIGGVDTLYFYDFTTVGGHWFLKPGKQIPGDQFILKFHEFHGPSDTLPIPPGPHLIWPTVRTHLILLIKDAWNLCAILALDSLGENGWHQRSKYNECFLNISKPRYYCKHVEAKSEIMVVRTEAYMR